MERRSLKFPLIIAGFAVAMGLLIVAGMRQPGGYAYYLTVSEFLSQPESRHRDGFRVNGKVAGGTIERLPSGQDARFVITDGATTMPVAYHGIIPDTFVDGADVVVEGQLGTDGVFAAHTLLAKCPSKYESADDPAAAPLEAALRGVQAGRS